MFDDLFVKVGLTIHKISKFQPTDTTVKANLEVYFTYKKDEIINHFYKYKNINNLNYETFEEQFKFPYLIANCISVDEIRSQFNLLKKIKNDNTNYHNNNTVEENYDEYKLEKYVLNCELEVVNFTNLLPFNKMLVPINIITDGSPGTEKIKLVEEITKTKLQDDVSESSVNLEFIEDYSIDKNYYFLTFSDYYLNKKYGSLIVSLPKDLTTRNNLSTNLKFSKNTDIESQNSNNPLIFENVGSAKIVNDWGIFNTLIYKDKEYSKRYLNNEIVWGKFSNDLSKNVFDFIRDRSTTYSKYITELASSNCERYFIIRPKQNVHKGSYSRVYFILAYNFSIMEDVIKYNIIPCILTSTQIAFYSLDNSTLAGLFPTIMLGNIALLFIQPETGKFTFNEKSVHFNIALTILICTLKLCNISLFFEPLFWILGIIFLNIILFVIFVIISKNKNDTINNILLSGDDRNIEMLYHGNINEVVC